MPLYVHLTAACKDDARRHNQTDEVERFVRKVERDQQTGGFEQFLPTPYLKKAFGKSFRLLAVEAAVGEDTVVCFLRFLPRGGDGEYDRLYRRILDGDPPEAVTRLIPDAGELKRLVADRRHHPVTPTQPPTAEEAAWLERTAAGGTPTDDLMVFETREWVEAVGPLTDYHVTLQGVVSRLSEHLDEHPDATALTDPGKVVAVLYRHFPAANRVLLAAPLLNPTPDRLAAEQARFAHYLSPPAGFGEGDGLLRVAARSYPLVLALDTAMWLAIERDEEANLALSPEETDILATVRRAGDHPRYPLFINGRAGSGKSTMLQHLAGDLVEFALADGNRRADLRPLYLTCSKDLLEAAKTGVLRLLTNHHERQIRGGLPADDVTATVADCFRTLQEFLLGLVPPAERKARFDRGRYVGYARFCRLWERDIGNWPEARGLSPDLTWHTIRTYIKGMRFGDDAELDPADYRDLPAKQQSVTQATFVRVYEVAWERWYKRLPDDDGQPLWDDQDLAGWLLRDDAPPLPTYPAVFCDEAQDFTRVELEVILRLSRFAHRTVPAYRLGRVPFAFAGDPFQTLNPTGFRWEGVQASFHERVTRGLARGAAGRVRFNYQELAYNYRSAEPVVRLCNAVQLLRSVLFADARVKLQLSWRAGSDAPAPCWFLVDDPRVRGGLPQTDLTILVNCDEGQEDRFVADDPVLREAVQRDDNGVARNVYSPIRAKGLEFANVVLYKFGESCPDALKRGLAGRGLPDGRDERLPLEYFFNRLYVAASRAKRRLMVVDTAKGFDALWAVFAEKDRFAGLVEAVAHRPQQWADQCGYLLQGVDWNQEGENTLKLAEQLRNRGLQDGSFRDLRQARMYFDLAAKPAEAGLCLAQALELEGRPADAGRTFQELSHYDDARRCFWRAADHLALRLLSDLAPAQADTLEVAVARLRGAGKDVDGRDLIDRLAGRLGRDGEKDPTEDRHWHDTVRWLAETAEQQDRGRHPPAGWAQLLGGFVRLRRGGFEVPLPLLAGLADRAGRADEARRYWDEFPNARNDDRYHRFMVADAPFPGRLRHLVHLGRWAEVTAWWEAGGRTEPAAREVAADVFHAYRQQGLWSQAAGLALAYPKDDTVRQALSDCLDGKGGKPTWGRAEPLVRQLIAAEVKADHWAAALDLTTRDGLKALDRLYGKGLERLTALLPTDLTPLTAELVRHLAAADALFRADKDTQTRVSDYLKQAYTARGQWTEWRRLGVPVRTAGAALERAGRVIDALDFYDTTEKAGKLSDDDRQFVRERLIRCRERRADLLRGQSQPAAAERMTRDAQHARDRWRVTGPLPDIPDPVRAAPAAGRPLPATGKLDWEAGGWGFHWSGANGRLRVVDGRTDRTVVLYTAKREAMAEGDRLPPRPGEHGTTWADDHTGLALTLTDGDPPTLTVRIGEAMIEQLRLAADTG